MNQQEHEAKTWERFIAAVPERTEGACWLWQGLLTRSGYGRLWNGTRTLRAHRYAWEIDNGTPVPDGMVVCHRCDTPACVNPAHLFLGTNTDNVHDRDAKGRTTRGDAHWQRKHPERRKTGDVHYTRRRPDLVKRGESSGRALTTEAEVRRIRELRAQGLSYRAIAEQCAVKHGAVRLIALGKSWRHVSV